MFKQSTVSNYVKIALATSIAVSPIMINKAFAAEESADETEVISVTGIRNSLKESAYLKRNASQVVDAITAEDIGKLPDNNIAEALQRVTGVQIGRDAGGEGAGFQVRKA